VLREPRVSCGLDSRHDRPAPHVSWFARHTDRRRDFYWGLNQVDLVLEHTDEPGVLRVFTHTFTPDLAAILVSIGDAEWTPSDPVFLWHMHAGRNLLRLKARNSLGVDGAESQAAIVWRGD
jgi:hypothetical protein